jgi:hypothetical protein
MATATHAVNTHIDFDTENLRNAAIENEQAGGVGIVLAFHPRPHDLGFGMASSSQARGLESRRDDIP